MERNEIIEACKAWAQEKENRVAVVVLAEPDENGGLLVNTLGNEIIDDRDFAAIIHAAVKVALIIKMKAEADDLGEELSDLLKKEK